MISFSQMGQMGRLGNQLFQYAAVRALSLHRGFELGLPKKKAVWHGQACPLDQFQIPEEFFRGTLPTRQKGWVEKDPQVYDPHFLDGVSDGSDIEGFFQNIKYFEAHVDTIKRELRVKEEVHKEAYERMSRLCWDPYPEDDAVVSIHVRRGDVVRQTKHLNFYGPGDDLAPDSIFARYLEEAKALIETWHDPAYTKYLVFTGGARDGGTSEDMEWCKRNIKGDNILYAEGNNELVDFEMMRLCTCNICCHATTFGWWAAFLNEHPGKIVVAPQRYFVTDQSRVVDGFYPEEFDLV